MLKNDTKAQLWQLPGTTTDDRGITGLQPWQVQVIWWMESEWVHILKSMLCFFCTSSEAAFCYCSEPNARKNSNMLNRSLDPLLKVSHTVLIPLKPVLCYLLREHRCLVLQGSGPRLAGLVLDPEVRLLNGISHDSPVSSVCLMEITQTEASFHAWAVIGI